MTKRLPPRAEAQPDLFTANFADIPIRDQRDTMERPFFSLSKKPRLTPIEYRVSDVWVKVTANHEFGMATIWDADLLIWAATQVTETLDRGLRPSHSIRFHPHHLLKAFRRSAGGALHIYSLAGGKSLTLSPSTCPAYGSAGINGQSSREAKTISDCAPPSSD